MQCNQFKGGYISDAVTRHANSKSALQTQRSYLVLQVDVCALVQQKLQHLHVTPCRSLQHGAFTSLCIYELNWQYCVIVHVE